MFRVFSYGGEFDCAWEATEGVCETFEIAEQLKQQVLSYYTDCNISEGEYVELVNAIFNYEEEHDEQLPDDEVEAILYLFPDKYSKEDLERAYFKYSLYVDFIGVDIEEVKFYDINS